MLGREKKEEEKKKEKSGFFQHFSLRRKTVNDAQKGDDERPPILPKDTSPSWSTYGSTSTPSTPTVTTFKRDTFRDRSPTETPTISVDDSAAQTRETRPMSRLQRASSMIRRGTTATTRKTREETAIEMFCRSTEVENISTKEEKKKRGFFARDKDEGGDGMSDD